VIHSKNHGSKKEESKESKETSLVSLWFPKSIFDFQKIAANMRFFVIYGIIQAVLCHF
jgi:hypothetical protein